MRSPEVILENLRKHSEDRNYIYRRLYRTLYSEEFHAAALKRSYAKGTERSAEEGISRRQKRRTERTVDALKNRSYQPDAGFDDRSVEACVKAILEAIYAPSFSKRAHGSMTGGNCHTALLQVRATFTGAKWIMTGKTEGFPESVSPHVMTGILRRRIGDEAFIDLIWKFIRKGALKNWRHDATFSGNACGRGLGMILTEILMSELDSFIEDLKLSFDRGKARRRNPEYIRRQSRRQREKAKIKKKWDSCSEAERENAIRRLAEMKRELQKVPHGDPMDRGYRRLQYVRCQESFIIGIIGSKAEAERTAESIRQFMKDVLGLSLTQDRMDIRSGKDMTRFLGYDIAVCRDEKTENVKGKGSARVYSGAVRLYLPHEAWRNRLIELGILKIKSSAGEKEKWTPVQKNSLICMPVHEMARRYNAELKSFYRYYRLAGNVSVLSKFRYVMEYSLYKTIAAKLRISMTKAKLKYTRDGEFRVPYETPQGTGHIVLYNEGFRKSLHADMHAGLDVMKNDMRPKRKRK